MELLTGEVKRIIYRNAENGYTVLELTDDTGMETAAVGTLPLCSPGERVELTGNFVEHKSYGRQFKADSCSIVAPATLSALQNYLASGLIKGVGEATAKNIVGHFGLDTLDILENDPERLTELPGIGRSRAAGIAASFFEQRAMRDIMMTLTGYGITVRQALQLYQLFGAGCLLRVEENPYSLVEDVEGIGFKTADKIAQNMGIERSSRRRLRAGLHYMLIWARQEGHTYLPREALLQGAAEMLECDPDLLDESLDSLIIDGSLQYSMAGETDAVYLPALHHMEKDCARRLLLLAGAPEDAATMDLGRELNSLERELGIELAHEQRAAVMSALCEGAMVITGGPGTGKTTILQFILRIMTRLGLDYALCAPTGRAAKRMTEATGFEAATIHRLLEYGGEGQARFARNEDNPLFYDMVLVDEMSMVDLPLMYALLRALPLGTRLIMVGDADQLPPVGAGTVLHDIIESGVLPVTRLTEIYRQSDRSGIARNAHRINAGIPPVPEPDSDFTFLNCPVTELALEKVISLCSGGDPSLFTCDPTCGVQVLSPTKKGPLGVKNLNVRLQAALNPKEPHKAEREFGEVIFREGDKVMQIKNDYRLEWMRTGKNGVPELGLGVYNGDLGTIYRMDMAEQTLDVLFDDERMASYTFSQLDELDLAYCISIHKSQGSEFPIVILPLFSGPPLLMTRNLLYTAVTRARRQVLIVGRWDSVLQMVENKRMRRRYSAMGVRMAELAPLLLQERDI